MSNYNVIVSFDDGSALLWRVKEEHSPADALVEVFGEVFGYPNFIESGFLPVIPPIDSVADNVINLDNHRK